MPNSSLPSCGRSSRAAAGIGLAGSGSIAFTDAAGNVVTAPLEITGPLRRDSLPADAGEATEWRFGAD